MRRSTTPVVLGFLLIASACGATADIEQALQAADDIETETATVEPTTPEPAQATPTDAATPTEREPATTQSPSTAPTPEPTTATTAPPTPVAPLTAGDGTAIASIDWWGCWRAADARASDGSAAADGQIATLVPNCATGPNSVGSAGDMSHPGTSPIFRAQGANGKPSIEFTFAGDTLLQTNGGAPVGGDDVVRGPEQVVTRAWVGMTTDIESHNLKFLVSGLNRTHDYPQLLVKSQGPNRFVGYGGGTTEADVPDSIVDDTIHGVILYLSSERDSSAIYVDGTKLATNVDSKQRTDIVGLTLGNSFKRGFSTTDHQFVFLGMTAGEMPEQAQRDFWAYLDDVRSG